MQIQVRTDYHVDGDEELIAFVEEKVREGLAPYADRIMSVQVHLSSESGARKGPADLACMIEVRPARRGPVVVRRHAATKDGGINAAVDGMRGVLGRLFGRSDVHHAGADSIRQTR
jgi:hypothetical protein